MNPKSPTPSAREEDAVSPELAVVIPTRSRPKRIARCLEHLAAARRTLECPVHVCDSSPSAHDRAAVEEVCARYEWVRLHHHRGANVTAARNFCARVAEAELLISLDDDIELEPDALERLLETYRRESGRRVVSGNVAWNGAWNGVKKMRVIGYGRDPLPGEQPDFAPGAFFLYPRALALALPWNERIDQSTDIFMGALWRSNGVRILFAPGARGHHPASPQGFGAAEVGATADHQEWRIYALLFDALLANPSPVRAVSYEVLGFLAAAKLYFQRPSWARRFLHSWIAGHRRLLRDRHYLRALVAREVPADG